MQGLSNKGDGVDAMVGDIVGIGVGPECMVPSDSIIHRSSFHFLTHPSNTTVDYGHALACCHHS